MRKLKKIIILTSIICSISAISYAKAAELTYKMTVNNGNISVKEDSLISNKDYSDMLVNVVKETNGKKSTIYSGKLSGYENGAYSQIDFSEINFMVIFEWDSMENEAIYIIPVTTQAVKNSTLDEIHLENASTENTVSVNNAVSLATIKTNMSLMYNDQYCENILMPGQTLKVPVSIANSGTSTFEVIPYIAKYDLSGRLLDVQECDQINALPNQTTLQTLSIDFDNDTAYTAKIFLWQKNTMMPIAKSVHLTVQNQDYYADTFEQASKIDISKQLCGIINTNSDVDIVKFTPTTTGIYALQLEATTGTVCGLYDSTQTLLNSISAVSDNNYLLYALTANQDYYIRFNGNINSNYKIVPTIPNETSEIIQNIGMEGIISNSTTLNIYQFTPQTSGEYIITAVNSSDVNAQLFNSSFEKISNADNTDSTVSFRITSSMTANQTYYIVVYPKNETTTGSYTMYVEEPFSVISVQ